jgi:hypothetical protein
MLESDQRLKTLGDMAVRTKLHFDLWSLTKHQDSWENHKETLEEYWNYLRFNREAHEQKFIVILANLVANARVDSIGVFQAIKECQSSGRISPLQAEKYKEKILAHNITRDGVLLIRNKLFAHRDSKKTYEFLWRQANLTINTIGQLIDTSLDVVNDLLEASGEQRRVAFSEPVIEFERLLKAARP